MGEQKFFAFRVEDTKLGGLPYSVSLRMKNFYAPNPIDKQSFYLDWVNFNTFLCFQNDFIQKIIFVLPKKESSPF